jgi:cell division protein FtsQ
MRPRQPRVAATGSARRPSARRWRLVRARSEAVPVSVRRFNQRARERRMRTARPWLVAAAVLVLLGIAGWVVYRTPVLGVREVRVTGNNLVSAEQVRAAAAIRSGTPLAGLDLSAVGDRVVAGLVPVARAVAARDWPDTVVITVTERVGVAVAQRADQRWVVLDSASVPFQEVSAPPDGLPVLVLANPVRGDAGTVAALAVLAALTPELRAVLVRLEAPSPNGIRLALTRDREIIWGDATQNEAKARVATSLLGHSGAVIDVSAPDVVTVN